jgi:hypothetical protein
MKPVPEIVFTKISRFTAWVAILMCVLLILTGYGMTKRIMNQDTAKYLHTVIFPIPLFVSLIVHGGLSARTSLRRWKVFEHDGVGDLYVLAISVVLLSLFLWLFLE